MLYVNGITFVFYVKPKRLPKQKTRVAVTIFGAVSHQGASLGRNLSPRESMKSAKRYVLTALPCMESAQRAVWHQPQAAWNPHSVRYVLTALPCMESAQRAVWHQPQAVWNPHSVRYVLTALPCMESAQRAVWHQPQAVWNPHSAQYGIKALPCITCFVL